MNPQQTKVYKLLVAAAEAGRPCPTNFAIAEALDITANGYGSALINQLEEIGMITVERRPQLRVITITATGKRTSDHSASLSRDARSRAARMVPKVKPNPPVETLNRVYRDACFRCGNRGDVCVCKGPRRA